MLLLLLLSADDDATTAAGKCLCSHSLAQMHRRRHSIRSFSFHDECLSKSPDRIDGHRDEETLIDAQKREGMQATMKQTDGERQRKKARETNREKDINAQGI